MPLNPIDRDALWACHMYSLTERHLPEQDRVVCLSWVNRVCQRELGRSLHNSHLQRLARLGLLAKDDTSRQGCRRYYRLTELGIQEAGRSQHR